MKKLTLILFVIGLLNGLVIGQVTEKTLSLSAKDIKELSIDCGAGFLKVTGEDKISEIIVEAEIVLEGISKDERDDFLDDHLTLELKKRGSRAHLISKFDSNFGIIRSIFSNSGQRLINLTVKVPSNIDLDIDDGSGFTEIRDISGDADIKDGSGSLHISNIEGEVSIIDGSGALSVENITGDLDIEDGSGELEIEDIKGKIIVDDGSGTLILNGITGNIKIDDGSGNMRINHVTGNVEVSDGSGSITISDVSEDVIIREAGSGSVDIDNVKGSVIRKDK